MNSRVMLLLAAVLALAAGVAGYMGYKTTQEAREEARLARVEAQAAKAAAPEASRFPIVIAQRAIPAYHQITAEDVVIDHLRLEPPYTYRRLEDVIGKVPQTAIAAGQMVVQGHLDPGSEIARLLKPGERGLAIAIDEVVGGGGFVQPGDTVDVLLFVQGDSRPTASAQVVMRALRVVGMGTRVVGSDGLTPAQPGQPEGQQPQRQQSSTAVLAVTEPEATRLMLASSVGVLRLAIRPASETIACHGAEAGQAAVPAASAPGSAASAPATAGTAAGSGEATPCDDRASNLLAPGKTSAANNRLVRAGTLLTPGATAAVPATRRSAPRASAPRAQQPAKPTITIFRGLNNSTYP